MLVIVVAGLRLSAEERHEIRNRHLFVDVRLAVAPVPLQSQKSGDVQVWLTNADKSALFELQKPLLRFSKAWCEVPTIEIDDQKSFQTIDGFRFALTGGSDQRLPRWTKRRERRCSKSFLPSTARTCN